MQERARVSLHWPLRCDQPHEAGVSLSSLDHGMPGCAGVALGFDRLVMTALSLGSIDEAMAFPIERA